ncbi:MAG: single-stranded-DNA-specific exonuclease RecJ [Polyangiaceae bacterium]|nr:single-stranded-DNA-specific exonuclease RecJ [Polyangiaceae bacterium]
MENTPAGSTKSSPPAPVSSERAGAGATEPSSRDPGPADAVSEGLRAQHGLTFTGADVLHRLAVPSAELTKWLDPKLSGLTSPAGMADREAATERIARAITKGERICIFGDYDCDGITAAAVLTSVVRALGGVAVPLLATRMEGAYGLSAPALARVKATGATLLVTCDCGSSDHERLEDARRSGIDVVVIDHHLVPKDPLPALAFLNPHRPECEFPFKHLASCGLALSMGAALRQALKRELDLRPMLDLVAIGTVADVAPLVGDNRALVRAGLRVLGAGVRPGIRALADLARIDLSRGMTSEDIGFRIAPRLNAPGRLGHPDESLELLLTRDHDIAAGLAASIEQTQLQRRQVQAQMLEEALADIEEMRLDALAGVVVARQGWHPGVVGIVAGKLAETLGKPTIVIGLEGASGRGSVRGPTGFPLYDALTDCRADLAGYGGHQAAAGVHVRSDRIDALRASWHATCAVRSRGLGGTGCESTARLDPRDPLARVLDDFDRFEPFGEANPMPLLYLPEVEVIAAKNLKGHLKLDLAHGRAPLTGIYFSMGECAPAVAGKTFTMIGALRRNTFQGGAELQVRSTWPRLPLP